MDERPFMDAALRSIDLVFLELAPGQAIHEGLMILGENIGAHATAILVRHAGSATLILETTWTAAAVPVDIFSTIGDEILRQITAAANLTPTQAFRMDTGTAQPLLLVPLLSQDGGSAFLAAILPEDRMVLAEPVMLHCALSVSAIRTRIHAEQARRQAADEAMAARRVSDLLLARVGHEFRTPLVALVGISTLLDERGSSMTVERRQAAYQLIRKNGERLSALVDKLMNVARIRAGRRPLSHAPLDFNAIISTAETTMAGLLASKDVSFIAHIDNTLPADFSSDQAAILEVLDNLLGNAAKFTAHGQIALTMEAVPGNPLSAPAEMVTACGDVPETRRVSAGAIIAPKGTANTTNGVAPGTRYITFTVRDSGIGMDPGLLADLNQPFHASRLGLTGETGSGLGLATATALVEQLGGVMSISAAESGGTSISFTLPSMNSGQTCP
jgi:signal transduction histidine kinase